MVLLFLAITSCAMYEDMQAMKAPRYEVGDQKGALFCANCHREIYDQWLNNSRHSVATTAVTFNELKDKFTGNILLNTFMGESMCYACHGSKEVNEGVNCETCHGAMPADASIVEAHENKFRPELASLKQPEFCARCHEVKNPLSGDFMLAMYDEWQRSAAAADGVTCQGCHMAPRETKHAYHGFDTAVRNASIYRDDLSVGDVVLDFPQLRMTTENRVKGHSIPAGGLHELWHWKYHAKMKEAMSCTILLKLSRRNSR